MSILITGSAGFIGFHTTLKYLKTNNSRKVIGIDNINNYYDTKLKTKRLRIKKKIKILVSKKNLISIYFFQYLGKIIFINRS